MIIVILLLICFLLPYFITGSLYCIYPLFPVVAVRCVILLNHLVLSF